MTDCNLLDIQTIRGLFTWRKNVQRGGHIRKILDTCMADVDWQLLFPHALVSCDKARSNRAKLFHFQAAWMSHPEYEAVVHNTWSHSHGNAMLKLDKVRERSLIFNREVFGNIFKRKRHLEGRIKGVHRQLDISLSSALIKLERELQDQYNDVLAQEELLWFQKSREKWVELGNKNTKFFHTQTVIRRRRNKITGLMIKDTWCSVEDLLKTEALAFFKKLFQANNHCSPHSL